MTSLLKQAYSPDEFRKNGHLLVDMLANLLEDAQQNKPGSFFKMHHPEELHQMWKGKLMEGNKNLPDFFSELLSGSLNLQHPRYMGHQVAIPLPVTALSGMFTSLLNNGMAVYEVGNAASVLEKMVTDMLATALGFPEEAGGMLTSGGTLANLTALLTARAMITGADIWENGHSIEPGGKEQLALMVSEEAHYCVDRAVRVMGWGSKGVIKIPVDVEFRMRTDLLSEYLAAANKRGIRVIAVVGSACSTSTGSYDNLEEIGHFCQQNNLWFHVDGAHGSAVAFSKKYKHRVKGIELADSVVTDFHKLLMTPGLATAVIYKNGMHAFNTFRQDAQYLWNNVAITDHYNFGKKTFECTKLMMGVKIFSILHQYGLQVFEDYIDTVQQNAEVFADAVAAHPSFELALPPQSNIVCFRYAHGIKNEEEANRLNRAIRTQLLANGKFFIVQTTIKGKIYLRVSLMNPFTSLPDMLGLLKEAAEIGNAEKLA